MYVHIYYILKKYVSMKYSRTCIGTHARKAKLFGGKGTGRSKAVHLPPPPHTARESGRDKPVYPILQSETAL